MGEQPAAAHLFWAASCLRGKLLHGVEDCLGVSINFDFVPALDDLSLGVDEECRSDDPHVRAPIARLFLPDPILLCNLVFGIGEEGERHIVLRRKTRLARFVEDADSKHHRLTRLEARQAIAKVTGLLGASWSVVLRVEVEDDGVAQVVGESLLFAGLIRESECRRFLPRVN